MYVQLNNDYFEKHKEEASILAASLLGKKESEGLCIFEDLKETTAKIDEIDGDTATIEIDSPLGYFSFNVKISPENQIFFLEQAIKKANKIKTLLEASK